MRPRRIAIVGGGCAGTVAAWALRDACDVTVFEAENALGGHAYSHSVMADGESVSIDMAVEYFTERLSPNLCALLRHLGVDTFLAPLSFRAEFPGERMAWSNIDYEGVLRQQLNSEMDRLHRDMMEVIVARSAAYKKMSIGEYLTARGYSPEMQRQAILPLMSTFSGCDAPSLDYSLLYLALSINMNLLSFFGAGQWRKARGGINGYLAKIARELGDRVKVATPVRAVRRKRGGLEVQEVSGATHAFDAVVFATHADVALSMIESPSAAQKQLLGGFEYVPITSVLHSDESLIGSTFGRTEYCEFRGRERRRGVADQAYAYGDLTRVNNRLAEYRTVQRPLLVTFDPKREPDANTVLCRKRWKLPKLRPVDMARKLRLREIQGVEGVWFCGMDTTFTGHEGALTSGLVIANRLGAPYPFVENDAANLQFNLVRDLMGVRRRRESVTAAVGDIAFSLIARTNLARSNAHRVVGEFLF
jgi:uncharacterized protein